MKLKISLGRSTSLLIGAVIVILALLRGPAQTVLLLAAFALWGFFTILRPAWQADRAHQSREERAAREQEAFSGVNLAGLLLCHVNYRVSDYLKSAYPNARWEWTMNDPALFIACGGTGRIRLYGVPDYEYADVTLDQKGGLSCSLVKIVPVQDSGQSAPSGQPTPDPSVWYELEGRNVLDALIADLRSRGHSSLTLNEDESRPPVCRIYPFSVRPGQRGRIFEFCRCVDQHAAHFSGDRVQVKDWLRENFTRESREFWAAEGDALPVLGRLLSSLDTDKLQASLFQILHYRYYNYDLDRPFMPQHKENMAALERFLRQRLGEV